MPSIPQIRKALTAAGAMVAAATTAGILTGNWAFYVGGAVATVAAGFGVFYTPNEPPK